MIRHQGYDGILKQTIVSDLNKTGLHEKTAYFALYYTISQIAVLPFPTLTNLLVLI